MEVKVCPSADLRVMTDREGVDWTSPSVMFIILCAAYDPGVNSHMIHHCKKIFYIVGVWAGVGCVGD